MKRTTQRKLEEIVRRIIKEEFTDMQPDDKSIDSEYFQRALSLSDLDDMEDPEGKIQGGLDYIAARLNQSYPGSQDIDWEIINGFFNEPTVRHEYGDVMDQLKDELIYIWNGI